ncbi:MAG: cytochrome c oxidase subunit II [Gemmatimonadaceae bacterium]
MQIGQTRLDTHAPSFMHPAGGPAGSQAALGWELTAAAVATVIIISVILIVALAKRRRPAEIDESGHGSARWKIKSGVNWIYTGLAITVVVLIVTFGLTVASINASTHAPNTPPITLNITAHQWWWEADISDSVPSHSFTTANEIHVPVGVPILVRVQSPDVIHSFWIPELGGKIDVVPGQINESWIRADRAGVYRGQCAEYCGLQHAHMAFTVVAEPPAEYEAWAAAQREEASTPDSNTTAAAGEAVFTRSCGGCHAVRGSGALGRIGPDLTHVAGRLTIAAGLIDNSPTALAKWIQNPQAMKPGVYMPTVGLAQTEVDEVVAYLETLH